MIISDSFQLNLEDRLNTICGKYSLKDRKNEDTAILKIYLSNSFIVPNDNTILNWEINLIHNNIEQHGKKEIKLKNAEYHLATLKRKFIIQKIKDGLYWSNMGEDDIRLNPLMDFLSN